mmetsp:Transcript_70598/g.117226  ORF Transcript_70598/g.117226 Transcript_70598/m.117226 type:complete len:193 (+) Transcript_70598:17-595(+)|eukprot:CAMPEP_0119312212 /NCGR_PEP_ID=MMETSP1333-20130426/25496_1 /TAXON_ID=418940 /ORGANISM="Scyphosphaera apsteinii, Strain RCC1455" /LENGTH=192 /DNA_ID=CAMNT_0007316799 /DNA_START=17 /DNA_END=595 /DNA_ORIENTATION=+
MAHRGVSVPEKNDGGIVVALVLLIAMLCTVFFSAIVLYASADIAITKDQKEKTVRARRIARLLSGWANIGNAVVHALLIVMLVSDTKRFKVFFPDEAEMPAGPIGLLVLNALVGLKSLKGGGIILALGWNSFIALAGSFIPIVWPKFIDVGIATWPYLAIFLWLGIYAFESAAFFFSVVAFTLKDAHVVKED